MDKHDVTDGVPPDSAARPDLDELQVVLKNFSDDVQRVTATATHIMNSYSMKMGELKHVKDVFQGSGLNVGTAVPVLKALHNHFCPANTLPPHIWYLIFRFVTTNVVAHRSIIDRPDCIQAVGLRMVSGRLNTIVQVCRYWHYVCVTAPSLWSGVSWPVSQFQDAVIERHPNMPLDLFFKDSVIPDVFFELPKTQCRTLKWTLCTYENIRDDMELLSTEVLEDLVLMHDRDYFSDDEDDDDDGPTTSPKLTLFGDSTPRLQSVSLYGLHWAPNNRFSTVTQLLIGYCFWSHPVTTILNLLGGTPQLVDLVLSGMLQKQRGEAESVGRAGRVCLKDLRRFALHNVGVVGDGVALLLSKLDLSPQTIIVANGARCNSSADGPWISAALSRLNLGFVKPTRMHLVSCAMSRKFRQPSKLLLSVVAASRHGGLFSPGRLVSLVDQGYRFSDVFPLSQVQDLCYLESFYMNVEDPWSSRMWSSILSELPALEQLTVLGRNLPHIAQGLEDSHKSGEGSEHDQQPICPRLTRIVVFLSSQDPHVGEVMARLAAIRDRLPFSKVTVGYLPGYYHDRWTFNWGYHPCPFEAEYVDYKDVPPMETPWPDHPELPELPTVYWPSIAQWTDYYCRLPR